MEKIQKTEDQWRKELPADQYEICRLKGTERPFTGAYWKHHEKGVYACAACGQELFSSDVKFDSGTGWPSFREPMKNAGVETKIDRSRGQERMEVLCSRCGSHLGHVFKDGPKPTGERYCINSAALKFKAA